MSDEKNGKIGLFELLRLATPIGIFLLGLLWNSTRVDISEIKQQIFTHLTNSEIHIPRASVVSRDEFLIYQAMRDKQMADVKDGLCRIESLMQKHISQTKRGE